MMGTDGSSVVIELPRQVREAMVAHARFAYPEEACGLIAGDGRQLRMVYCLTNVEHSATSYTIDPVEHFRAWQHAESRGWDLVGAFHSHPLSAAYPSRTDLELAAEPGWVYFIVGRDAEVRGFYLRDGGVTEAILRIG
jgi:proteasome lid subunit RPN8/RPN11